MPLGLYVHIPFCRAKCAYCDFNSYAGLEQQFDDYCRALRAELRLAGPGPVRSVYFGGGTPTVLPPSLLESTRLAIDSAFSVQSGAEISIEANPGTVNREILGRLRALGFNRLSLGVQSFDDGELRQLGRIHTATQSISAFDDARQSGFSNVGLDLIYGLPGQELGTWRASLDRALSLSPDHLSLYALEVEPGTPLAATIARGELPPPDPDVAADMYELAQDLLAAEGWIHYEISNWARPGSECEHNLIYWRNEPYLGVGAGAHSWSGGRRWSNVESPTDYTARVLDGARPIASDEAIGAELEMGETMMLGLRLVQEGVSFDRFRERFGVELDEPYGAEAAELEKAGLLIRDSDGIRLSRRGRLLGNAVFRRFLPDAE